jgi:hypothetical protein
MYGNNATFVVFGDDSYGKQYNMASNGVTIGVNLDIKIGRKNKISTGLFVPLRSSEFKDNYKNAKDDPHLNILLPLMPIAFGIGFNFLL